MIDNEMYPAYVIKGQVWIDTLLISIQDFAFHGRALEATKHMKPTFTIIIKDPNDEPFGSFKNTFVSASF
ncbi:hypothetical protein F6Y05_33380 [Bacillus megaterium]|nr:hypothetical protein [Priestia megaterium]